MCARLHGRAISNIGVVVPFLRRGANRATSHSVLGVTLVQAARYIPINWTPPDQSSVLVFDQAVYPDTEGPKADIVSW